ncbi:MAG TPA: hypothetical protein VFP58_13535, partial [Candidatus Eisenbacteria bacterium]|nr:hypothetical protein [Candidatus Eisenbacteria bacterium]
RVSFSAAADDENQGPFPIGFEFPFYDQSFTQFRVCTNGWISFTSSSTTFSNQPLPSPLAPENLIAAVWQDLIVSGQGAAVYYYSEPGRLIVQWNNLRPFGIFSPEPFTFQAVLYPSGEILLHYQSVGSTAQYTTVGMQNAAKTDGLTVVFRTHYLHPGLSVRFFAPPRWLSVTPRSGVVPAGGSAQVTLTIDAAQLEAGDHAASLPVASNDPDLPVLAAGVLVHVGSVDAAAADIDPNTLNLESNGRWIVGHVELPPPHQPSQVVASTVRLRGTVPLAEGTQPELGDFNENGIPDVQLRFDRAAVEAVLPEGNEVPITITGEIHEVIYFTARDQIRVIRPRLTAPNGGETLPAGSVFTVRWEDPQGWNVDRADLVVSLDGGESWQLLAENVTGNSYPWTIPHTPTTRARIRVHVYDAQGVMGYDATDGAFTIQPTVSAVETEEGAPPSTYALHQNAPNPFNPVTWIRFDLPRPGRVALRIYSVDGRLVREWRESLPAGRHRVRWDGRTTNENPVASGVYFARLAVEGPEPFEASRRMLMVK